MDRIILRISCALYVAAVSVVMWLVFNPSQTLAAEIQLYMQWWYSQPNSDTQAFVANLGLIALLVSLIGALGLLFLKKWAGYLFIGSLLALIGTEWLLPGYAPRSSIEVALNTVASVSAGCLFAIILLSKQLNTFEHKKMYNET